MQELHLWGIKTMCADYLLYPCGTMRYIFTSWMLSILGEQERANWTELVFQCAKCSIYKTCKSRTFQKLLWYKEGDIIWLWTRNSIGIRAFEGAEERSAALVAVSLQMSWKTGENQKSCLTSSSDYSTVANSLHVYTLRKLYTHDGCILHDFVCIFHIWRWLRCSRAWCF